MTDQDQTDMDQAPENNAYGLDRTAVAEILFAVDVGSRDKLVELMEPLHAADIADLLEQINGYDRERLIRLYGKEFDGEILSELEEGVREEVIDILHPQVLAEAVREMESDDVVDLVEDLEEPQKAAILGALEDADRDAVTRALTYPEGSAGRLMQRETVAAPEHWTVGEAIDFLRGAEELPDQFYHVILVDPRMHPIGNVTLGRIMASRRDVALRDIVEDMFRTIPVDQDESDVAYAFNQYHLISAPVVDGDGRLVGAITIDDAMAVLDEEHEEDILLLAGVGEESSLSDSVIETCRMRLPWLGVNLGTAILASAVISMFEDTIVQFVALAVLLPIVASMGGNAGTQSLTVAVRAIATKDLTGANLWRVIRREAMVGLINGLAFALVLGLVSLAWFGSPVLGYVIAAAMVINLVVAGLAGAGIPVLLDRFGVDPALASGTFVTTVTDVVGFFAFLGLAAMVLLLTALPEAKAAARKAAFARRKAAFAAAGPGAAARLSEVLAGYRGVPLAGYMPIRTEIDPLPAMAEAAAYGPVGVPVIQAAGQALRFSRWYPGRAMRDGPFGACVPQTDDFFDPEIVIVPLVAFDLRGNRLGYGGGFYDRTLEVLRSLRPTLAIGFAWDAQQTDALPLEPTDQRLDMVVTETRVADFR